MIREEESIRDRRLLEGLKLGCRAPSSSGVCETCGERTHDRKPRCAEHVLELPYVREVLRAARRLRIVR